MFSGHAGVYRLSGSIFYLSNKVCNRSVYADIALTYSVSGDAPVTGDWRAIYPPAPSGVLVPPTAVPVPAGGGPGD